MKHALCYVSTVDPNLAKGEIEEILHLSSLNNNNDNITGLLLYSNGNFFQVLEGEKELILELFEKIKQDSRHYDLITIFKKTIPVQNFHTYENQFLSLEATYSSNDLDLYASQVEKLDPGIQTSVKYILNKFS